MQETEAAVQAHPFLQGDIIEIVDAQGNRIEPLYGIIINADCDLAHCKIDGVVAYIPVFPFDIYFERFWIPTFVDSTLRELISAIAQKCGLTIALEADLCNWLREETVAEVALKLSTAYSLKKSEILGKLEELSLIVRAPEYGWELLESLVRLQGSNRSEILSRHAKRALKNMGEGNFFINEISGLSDVGFVARMRRLYSIDADCVFSSRSAFLCRQKMGQSFAVRIARLTNLYRFKVAQIFAMQFSRIGLPDEITSLNEIAVQAAISNMRPKNV